MQAYLRRVGKVVVVEPPEEIRECPRGDILEWSLREGVALDDPLPCGFLVLHPLGKLERPDFSYRQAEVSGDPRPQPLPSELAAVGDVVGLVPRLLARRHPGQGA